MGPAVVGISVHNLTSIWGFQCNQRKDYMKLVMSLPTLIAPCRGVWMCMCPCLCIQGHQRAHISAEHSFVILSGSVSLGPIGRTAPIQPLCICMRLRLRRRVGFLIRRSLYLCLRANPTNNVNRYLCIICLSSEAEAPCTKELARKTKS